jgi:hypothetical protein
MNTSVPNVVERTRARRDAIQTEADALIAEMARNSPVVEVGSHYFVTIKTAGGAVIEVKSDGALPAIIVTSTAGRRIHLTPGVSYTVTADPVRGLPREDGL